MLSATWDRDLETSNLHALSGGIDGRAQPFAFLRSRKCSIPSDKSVHPYFTVLQGFNLLGSDLASGVFSSFYVFSANDEMFKRAGICGSWPSTGLLEPRGKRMFELWLAWG